MPPVSLLYQCHNIRNTMASALSLSSTMAGVKQPEARISPGVIRCRARILGTALVLVTVAKHRTYSFIVCDVPRTFGRVASTFTAPSIANMGEHKRSGSPDPLPVPPPHYKGSYRDDRARHGDPERHRPHRRRDHDRGQDRVHGGKVRVRDFGCAPCGVTHVPCACRQQSLQVTGDLPRERVSRSFARHTEPHGHPDFQFSRCTGRKRAVCVSEDPLTVPNVPLCITKVGSRSELIILAKTVSLMAV